MGHQISKGSNKTLKRKTKNQVNNTRTAENKSK